MVLASLPAGTPSGLAGGVTGCAACARTIVANVASRCSIRARRCSRSLIEAVPWWGLLCLLLEQLHEFGVALFSEVRRRNEPERRRVDAVAQPGRGGAVVEHMAQVGIGMLGTHFGAV